VISPANALGAWGIVRLSSKHLGAQIFLTNQFLGALRTSRSRPSDSLTIHEAGPLSCCADRLPCEAVLEFKSSTTTLLPNFELGSNISLHIIRQHI
jgi:hypothetical protein